jgi:hypothetical protein
MPRKLNRTRPWTLAGSITYEDAIPTPYAIVLTATLKTGQTRAYYYAASSPQTAAWMITSATNGADAGNIAKKFTQGRTGGMAFALPIRALLVVPTVP